MALNKLKVDKLRKNFSQKGDIMKVMFNIKTRLTWTMIIQLLVTNIFYLISTIASKVIESAILSAPGVTGEFVIETTGFPLLPSTRVGIQYKTR